MLRLSPMASIDRIGAVLIIDPDEAIRHLLAALLGRAGFATEEAGDGDGLQIAAARYFDVIIRDVDLTPRNRLRSLRELDGLAPEMLRRTVITTAAPASALERRMAARPFAVLSKPFDLDVVIETVRECCGHGRQRRHPVPAAAPSPDDEGSPIVSLIDSSTVDLTRLEGFVRSVPRLRALLAREASSMRELLLRNEVRRSALELSVLFDRAAQVEADGKRAAVFLGAAVVAADLAGRVPPVTASRDQ